jgi:hypothetical protein
LELEFALSGWKFNIYNDRADKKDGVKRGGMIGRNEREARDSLSGSSPLIDRRQPGSPRPAPHKRINNCKKHDFIRQ